MVTRRGGEFLVQLRNLKEDPTGQSVDSCSLVIKVVLVGSWRQSHTQADGESVSEELTCSIISKAVGK